MASELAQDRLDVAIDWNQTWNAPAPRPLPEAPLSAEDAVSLALHNHPTIQRSLAELAAAKAAWAQAGRLPNPMLEVIVGLPVDGLGGDPWMASLLQQVTWLWTRGPRVERAASELRAQALRVCELAINTAAVARTAHARVEFATRGLEPARALRAAAHAAGDVAAQRFAVGEATELERGPAALEALLADDLLAQAELKVREAEIELVAACGVATAATVRTDLRAPAVPRVALTDAELLALAGDRFDVQAAIADAQAAAAGTTLAERGRWPEVSAGARFERMEDGREVVFPVLSLVPPIFDDGSARVSEADAKARAALSAAEAVWQRAVSELRRDLARLHTATVIAQRARHAIVPLAQSISAAADAALAAGVVDPGEAFEARMNAARAQITANAAELAAAEAFFEVERDAGVRLAAAEVQR